MAAEVGSHATEGFAGFLSRCSTAGFASRRYDVDEMPLYVNNGSALWIGFALNSAFIRSSIRLKKP